jgi:hypothetical protein
MKQVAVAVQTVLSQKVGFFITTAVGISDPEMNIFA